MQFSKSSDAKNIRGIYFRQEKIRASNFNTLHLNKTCCWKKILDISHAYTNLTSVHII
ncbi:unnamed protein product [Schistosoma margrebowiei]|uniref:Uncharacterized protein n=1 Tax=Schistosoma margrebowiei TaxID=48269 RepID=A0A183LQ92_9TREM|nr:unnamed protein product [Schistosoma margrebowiei]